MSSVADHFLREQVRMETNGDPLVAIDRNPGHFRSHFSILYLKHQPLDYIGVMKSSLLWSCQASLPIILVLVQELPDHIVTAIKLGSNLGQATTIGNHSADLIQIQFGDLLDFAV